MKPIPAAVFIIPAGMMVLALLPMPYGYYQLLRLVACGCAAFAAVHLWQRVQWLSLALALISLIFNPILPVHFDRDIWSVMNIVAAVVFGLGWLLTKQREKPTASQGDAIKMNDRK